MRYTFKDLVELVPVTKRAEFTKVYEYLHKIENPQENEILEMVSNYFKVTPGDIKSDKRYADVVMARHVYMTTVKVCSTKTLAEVARTINKDHATVCHALRNIRRDYDFNSVRRHMIRNYIAELDPVKQELLLDFFNERNPDILAAYAADAKRVTTPAESKA
jgi:chromosomal replication initiation ATPase DnaA